MRSETPGTPTQQALLVAAVGGLGGLGERLTAEEVTGLLHGSLAMLHDVIIEHDGRLGVCSAAADQVVALFSESAHPCGASIAAAKAALSLVEHWQRQTNERQQSGSATLDLGIGLHEGPMWAGPLGRMAAPSFVIVGEAVGLTVRLAQLCRQYGVRIIASEALAVAAQKCIAVRTLDQIPVKGRVAPLEIVEVLSHRPAGER